MPDASDPCLPTADNAASHRSLRWTAWYLTLCVISFLLGPSLAQGRWLVPTLLAPQPASPIATPYHKRSSFDPRPSMVLHVTTDSAVAQQEADVPEEPARGFKGFGLNPTISGGLRRVGFLIPSDVQAAALPRVLSGGSVAVQSHTGSGKTAVFLLPMLSDALDSWAARRKNEMFVTSLIVAPSQELCMQIVRVAETILGPDRRWMVQQVIGGANIERQRMALRMKRPFLVIGTPGRLAAMIGTDVGVHHVRKVALDEVDALMEPTFQDDMAKILQHIGKKVPGGAQYILTSASLTDTKVEKIRELWHLPPMERVLDSTAQAYNSGKMKGSMSPTLTHWHVMGEPRTKVDTLRRIITALDAPKTLVFMNEARLVKDTLFRLQALTKSLSVAIMHSEMPPEGRQAAIAGFQNGQVQVLVVTDVVARGMDLDCDAVINLEVPEEPVQYAHRAGRTGRMGRAGSVVTIVCPYETIRFERLRSGLGIEIPEKALFGGEVREPGDVPTSRKSNPKRPKIVDVKAAPHDAPAPLSRPNVTRKSLRDVWAATEVPVAPPAVLAAKAPPSIPAPRPPLVLEPPRAPQKKTKKTPPWQWQERLSADQREAIAADRDARAARRKAALERQLKQLDPP